MDGNIRSAGSDTDQWQKIIIVAHEVGDQYPNATIQTITYHFYIFYQQPVTIPLGRFHFLNPRFWNPTLGCPRCLLAAEPFRSKTGSRLRLYLSLLCPYSVFSRQGLLRTIFGFAASGFRLGDWSNMEPMILMNLL